ncbi:MAG: spore germination protein GerW family protein [Dehalococcoidia bacterium]
MSETPIPAEVQQSVERRLNGASDVVLNRLADTLGAKASASAAYGPAIERGTVTVIPVAKIRWAFGGGGGTGRAVERGDAEGTGGGGGTMVSPIGYITVGDQAVEFHPIKEPIPAWMLPPVLVTAIVSAFGALTAFIIVHGLGPLRKR